MENEPEPSLVYPMPVPDNSQEIEDDPLPNLIEEMNRFRSRVPIACQELFNRIKESYKESFIDFPALNKEVMAEDIQAKYSLNLYFKERIIGELSIPHFEFDDDLNELFCRRWGQKIYQAFEKSQEEAQKMVEEYRENEGLNMVAAYCLPNVTKLGKGFETELIQLFLLEEVFRKTNGNIEELAQPHTFFIYSGNRKEKPGSFLDHRYVSTYFYIDLKEDGRIAGLMIILFDRSSIFIKQKMKKQAKQKAEEEKKLSQSQLSVRIRKTQSSSYLERMKKYENIYEGSQRYDEKVIQRLFVEMDIDNDGFVGREDLWKFCQSKKVLIPKEVLFFDRGM